MLWRNLRQLRWAALGSAVADGGVGGPYTVQISEVEINNNGLFVDASGNPQPAIFARGTFTRALRCTQQGFFLSVSDHLLQETVAVLLAATASGAPVGFTFVYCQSNGYARGNTFSISMKDPVSRAIGDQWFTVGRRAGEG